MEDLIMCEICNEFEEDYYIYKLILNKKHLIICSDCSLKYKLYCTGCSKKRNIYRFNHISNNIYLKNIKCIDCLNSSSQSQNKV